MSHHMHTRTRLRTVEVTALQVLFLFVLPIALLYFGIVPVTARVYVLLLVSVLIYGVIKKEGWKIQDIGLGVPFTRRAIKIYALATGVVFFALTTAAIVLHLPPTHHWWTNPHFLFLFLVLSFFQEFAFRGVLMPMLGRVFPDTFTVILVDALLFAGMHAIYPFPYIGVPVAFLGGLFFATLYRRHPNLILVTLSHAVLNFVVVWYGLFVITH